MRKLQQYLASNRLPKALYVNDFMSKHFVIIIDFGFSSYTLSKVKMKNLLI